jgi:hypothetical protein
MLKNVDGASPGKLKKGKEEPRLKFSKILERNLQKQSKIIRQ